MSIKLIAIAFIKNLPFGRQIYLYILSLYKKIVKPYRCRRLQRYGFKILDELNAILKTHGIEYYVSYGTLLGIIRECNFLKHDDDIDVWVNIEDVKNAKKFISIMLAAGFSFKHLLVAGDKILYYTFVRYGVSVDLFCFSRESDSSGMYLSGVYINHNIKYDNHRQNSWRRIKRPNVSSGLNMDYKGCCFVIPRNYLEVIESLYGKGWKIPNPQWVDEDTPQEFEYMDGYAVCIDDVRDIEG